MPSPWQLRSRAFLGDPGTVRARSRHAGVLLSYGGTLALLGLDHDTLELYFLLGDHGHGTAALLGLDLDNLDSRATRGQADHDKMV